MARAQSNERGELGHAFLIKGDAATLPKVKTYVENAGISTEGNPDVYIREYKQFTVDDARELRDRAQSRSVHGQGRVFIIVAPLMTVEAQNALLKTIEEPPGGARFFFIVSSPAALLPTVRSRSHVLDVGAGHAIGAVDVNEFLAATREERLDMMKPLYTHDEDDERDVRASVLFLEELERVLGSRVGGDEGARGGLRAVYRARKYMMDKGALLKALLEQVALLTPRM